MSNTRRVVSSHVKTELENGTLSLTGIFHSLSDPTILKVHHKTRSQQYPGFEMAEGSGYGDRDRQGSSRNERFMITVVQGVGGFAIRVEKL